MIVILELRENGLIIRKTYEDIKACCYLILKDGDPDLAKTIAKMDTSKLSPNRFKFIWPLVMAKGENPCIGLYLGRED